MAELVEMRPERIHGFGALLDKLLARPEHHRSGLLPCRFRLHEAHGGPLRRLDNRFRIGGIILLPFQERLDVVRGNQPDLMTVPRHFPRPVLRAGASFHRHNAWWLLRHEAGELQP